MKFYFALFFVLTFCVSLSAQSKKCVDYKDGKFKMTYKGKIIFIDRVDDEQTERYPDKNITINFRVKWIDACHYVLTPSDISKRPGVRKDARIYVTIDSTTSNSYFQTSTSNFNNMVVKGEMIKVGSVRKFK